MPVEKILVVRGYSKRRKITLRDLKKRGTFGELFLLHKKYFERKILVEFFIESGTVRVVAKNFKGRKRKNIEKEFSGYVKELKKIKNKIKNQEDILEMLSAMIFIDAIVDEKIIEGYVVYPVEIEIEKREVRLR